MASLVPGFEYDIFISYRQKDNKGDRWVSEFVDALKDELESTFKEEISVYFDINPHDGLLETHDVSASLKEKLKCLVFIPIISQTYCDPKCFAWQYEFTAFNKLAKEDQFGRDIKLAGGNVASRILPVKIHDLDQEDKVLLENELGGVLRSIEFIFKSAGVNRPLKPSDNPDKNLNKTYYRDQINKVANAIKEIITAINKRGRPEEEIPKTVFKENYTYLKKHTIRIISGSLLLLLLLIAGYFIIPKLSRSIRQPENTIAVLAFENLSDDKDNSWLGIALTMDINMQLNNIDGLVVRPMVSESQYRGTKKTIPEIGKELNVTYLINGNFQRSDDRIIISAYLINTITNNQNAIDPVVSSLKDFQSAQAEIAKKIASRLKKVLSPDDLRRIDKKMTDEPEAFEFYTRGNEYMGKSFNPQEIVSAIKWYELAVKQDPEFCMAYLKIAMCHMQLYWNNYDRSAKRIEKSRAAIDSAFKVDPVVENTPEAHFTLANYYYMGFQNYSKALEEINLAEKLAVNKNEYSGFKANIYRRQGEWKLARENYYRSIEFSPGNPGTIHNSAVTFFLLGDYKESEKYFKSAILINPVFMEPYWQSILMYMKWKGNTTDGRKVLSEAFQFAECRNNKMLFESNVLMDIYEGKYEQALSDLAAKDIDIISTQMYYNLKSMLYAKVYSLAGFPEKAITFYASARVTIDSLIINASFEDSRLHSALGISYAGLGQKGKAIEEGSKGVALMPVTKDAYFGVYRIEDLAKIFVMTGEYEKAIEQIRYLLAHPGPLSVKLLLLDPVWKPLWELPEFKKAIRKAPSDKSRIRRN